ncbi:hypothetical protein HPB48_017803 [Haemaphysalis longicornis]|uniref:Uncharacterized protein n=1 Tax=Haemaphysalis longicornis TaxID=44386 RepID=A0A9J6FML2_HAELO|nr:hypothetical protein HPB48_017803 [Haemaphysalis longicornis]
MMPLECGEFQGTSFGLQVNLRVQWMRETSTGRPPSISATDAGSRQQRSCLLAISATKSVDERRPAPLLRERPPAMTQRSDVDAESPTVPSVSGDLSKGPFRVLWVRYFLPLHWTQ